MNAIAPIDKAGRVVIPKAVREALELSDGDQLEISVEGDEIRMRVSEPEIGLIRKGKLWVQPATGRRLDPKIVQRTLERTRDYPRLGS